jgi:hypothetical protein
VNAVRIQQQIQQIKQRQNETTFLRTTDGTVEMFESYKETL